MIYVAVPKTGENSAENLFNLVKQQIIRLGSTLIGVPYVYTAQ